MHWDAMLDDGKGDLLFGRPIRWMLYLYGGRVVPFTIARTPAAQTSQVQDVPTGAVTYGHRFLTTSGRAGRAIKVRSFDEYRARLLENFVILERAERHNKIARELDAKAQRLQGRVSRTVNHETGLLLEVPDLVEYPSVVAGTFALEFLELPEEVLTTTLIHHQHYFPVEGDDGKLKNAFLAVINTEPDNERTIARNAERVVSARLRDARFFWEADRKIPLESRIDRLGTLLFHKKLGHLQGEGRADRHAGGVDCRARARRRCRDREARRHGRPPGKGRPRDRHGPGIPRAAGHHGRDLRPRRRAARGGVEGDLLPLSADRRRSGCAADEARSSGKAAVTWAAVSLADKLDTIVGLFAAGEKPTGSRDPYALRRAAQGVVKMLVDLQATSGVQSAVDLKRLIDRAFAGYAGALEPDDRCLGCRARRVHRGTRAAPVRAARLQGGRRPGGEGRTGDSRPSAFRRVEALAQARQSKELRVARGAVQARQEHHQGIQRRADRGCEGRRWSSRRKRRC